VVLIVAGIFTGLKYIYPPPQEQTFVIDFQEPEQQVQVEQTAKGNQPMAEVVNKQKDINLVQKSEAPLKGAKANQGKASTVDDFGDVDVPKPKTEKAIDNRALFHTADNKSNKDTLAAQTARKVSNALKAGHPNGNTDIGKTTGEPNAHLKGRSHNGSLPKPSYSVQNEGTVVVTIWVDQWGNVQKALAGASGTTVTDKTLWAAARIAAMKAHFNQDSNAPVLQQGTITYIFKLN
jgi:TonB family protein